MQQLNIQYNVDQQFKNKNLRPGIELWDRAVASMHEIDSVPSKK